jgi:hypothetical protein
MGDCKGAALEAADASTNSARYADQVVGNFVATREFLSARQRLKAVTVERIQPCMKNIGELSQAAGLAIPTREALETFYLERQRIVTDEFTGAL